MLNYSQYLHYSNKNFKNFLSIINYFLIKDFFVILKINYNSKSFKFIIYFISTFIFNFVHFKLNNFKTNLFSKNFNFIVIIFKFKVQLKSHQLLILVNLLN